MAQFGALGELAFGDVEESLPVPQQVNSAGLGALGEFALGEQGESDTSGGAVGLPIETDSAFAIQPMETLALGLATEADMALGLTFFLSGKRQLVAAIAS